MKPEPILLTEREVGKLLRIGRTALYKARQTKPPRIPFVQWGRTIRYPLASLPEGVQAEYLRAHANDGMSVGIDTEKSS